MTLRLVLTDGAGVQGLTGTFGAIVQTNIIQTAADAAAAAASATNAATSASSASGSAAAAATSAANAATQATNAANSATAASGSASSAAGSATAANTSATNAATSASSASGSATAASNSATNAANSATAAATSASNAAATLANALTKANNLSDVANAVTALANLNGAKRGANSDITSLNGLSTALSIAQGGTGATSAAAALTALGTQPTNNPTFTGNVGVPTRTAGDASDNAATTNFVAAAIAPMTGRNRIINGDCRVAQRASGIASSGVGGYGGPDRFSFNNAGPGGQFTQSQGTITYNGVTRAAVVQTVNTATSSFGTTNFWSGIRQPIEGVNCADFVGQPIALSFIFKAAVTGTYSYSIQDSTSGQTFLGTFAATANTPTRVAVSIPAVPAGANIPNTNGLGMLIWIGALNTGTYAGTASGSWQAANYIAATGATNWAATINNYIAVTDLQLEAGSLVTAFERRSYGLELALCQRYFWWTGNGQNSPVAVGQAYSTNSGGFTLVAPVTMRAAPTVNAVNIYVLNANGSNIFAVGSITPGSQGDNRTVYLGLTSIASAPLVAGNAVLIELGTSTGSINGFISLTAEL